MNDFFDEYGQVLVSVLITGIILSLAYAFVSGLVDFNILTIKNII